MTDKVPLKSKVGKAAPKKASVARPQQKPNAAVGRVPSCHYRLNKSNGVPFTFVVVKVEADGQVVDFGNDNIEFKTREEMRKAVKAKLGITTPVTWSKTA